MNIFCFLFFFPFWPKSVFFFFLMIVSLKKQPIIQLINSHIVDYPTPSNISYFWNFGFLAGMCLGIQILTGVALAMHYTPHVDLAFLNIENI